jgi:hypothetical protein
MRMHDHVHDPVHVHVHDHVHDRVHVHVHDHIRDCVAHVSNVLVILPLLSHSPWSWLRPKACCV